MCTYNGALYVREQLDSIAAQTRLPDELVICDDQSSDHTSEIVRSFAARAPFPVRLYVNEKNLGSTKNFERAIEICEGDIIALSDQDDVWHSEKLARMETVFSSAPNTGLVFTDAEVVDERLRPAGYTLWQCLGFDQAKQQRVKERKAFDRLILGRTVTGATMAFRSNFRGLILPIPDNIRMIHDGWIALTIATVADLAPIDESLIKYRQHSKQQIGAGTLAEEISIKGGIAGFQAAVLRKNFYSDQINHLEIMYERLSAKGSTLHCKEVFRQLEAMMIHFQTRASMPDRKLLSRLPYVLKEFLTLRYHHYSNGVHSAAKDLFL